MDFFHDYSVDEIRHDLNQINRQTIASMENLVNASRINLQILRAHQREIIQIGEKLERTDQMVRNMSSLLLSGKIISELVAEFRDLKGKLNSFFAKAGLSKIEDEFDYLFPGVNLCGGKLCPKQFWGFEGCEIVDNRILVLRIHVTIEDKARKIYRADPFTTFTIDGKEACQHKYMGPKYVMFDEITNCSHPVLEPTSASHRYASPFRPLTCKQQNGERWWNQQLCKPKNRFIPTEYVQIKYDRSNYYIYCNSFNITINGHLDTICKDEVYKIPSFKTVETGPYYLTGHEIEASAHLNVNEITNDLINSIIIQNFHNEHLNISNSDYLFEESEGNLKGAMNSWKTQFLASVEHFSPLALILILVVIIVIIVAIAVALILCYCRCYERRLTNIHSTMLADRMKHFS